MKTLSQKEIRQLHGAALRSRLDRVALLSGLPRMIADGIPSATDPAGQMLVDLNHLNDLEPVTAEAPLITWLNNALVLSTGRVESSVFAAALRALCAEVSLDAGAHDVSRVMQPSRARSALPLCSLGRISALDCHQDILATGHRGGAAALWDAATGKRALVFVGHRAAVCSLAFSPSGDRVAVATVDGLVRVHHRKSGKQQRPLRTTAGGARALVFHPHGHVLFGAGADGELVSWDLSTGKKLASLHLPTGVPVSMACPDDRLRVATIEGDLTRVFEVRVLDGRGTFPDAVSVATVEHEGVRDAALDVEAGRLVTVGAGTEIRTWVLPGGRSKLERAGPGGHAERIAVRAGRHVVVSSAEVAWTTSLEGLQPDRQAPRLWCGQR